MPNLKKHVLMTETMLSKEVRHRYVRHYEERNHMSETYRYVDGTLHQIENKVSRSMPDYIGHVVASGKKWVDGNVPFTVTFWMELKVWDGTRLDKVLLRHFTVGQRLFMRNEVRDSHVPSFVLLRANDSLFLIHQQEFDRLLPDENATAMTFVTLKQVVQEDGRCAAVVWDEFPTADTFYRTIWKLSNRASMTKIPML